MGAPPYGDVVIRTVVVDDEPLARARLRTFLGAIDDVELVGEAGNGIEALRVVQEAEPDLLLLDVQMPGMGGFELLAALKRPPQVIFATAYDEYAIRAFEVEAVDYLLKPVTQARVAEAVSRVRMRIEQGTSPDALKAILRRLERTDRAPVQQIPVQSGRRIIVLPTESIFWFDVEYRLVYAHVDGRAYMTNYTLKEIEERVDPSVFFRAHKSAIVNLTRVREIVPWFGGRYKLVMRDAAGSEVALSRTQSRVLRARLKW
jgi:two-component system LytT family response regulator/two-component system response regulator LytT